jgi:hypothetical protein
MPEALRRAVDALLSGAVPSRLETLIKGALLAMFIDKLKWSGVGISLAVVAAVSACSAVLVYQAAADSYQPAQAGSATPNPGPGGLLDPIRDHTGGERMEPSGDDDRASDTLEALRVQSELLEIEIDSAKQRLQTEIVSLHNLQRQQAGRQQGFGGGDDNVPAEVRAAHRKQLEDVVDKAAARLELDKREYLDNRLKLARMKRQIARQSKALNEPHDDGPNIRDVVQRMERLEARLDEFIKNQKAQGNRQR